MFEIPPAVIASLALISSVSLWRRFLRRRDWTILSAVLPRLYIAGLYLVFAMTAVSVDQRALLARWALGFLLFIEIVIQLWNWHAPAHRR